MEDIEVTLGYVHITRNTNGEEVTLDKEKVINTEKVTNKPLKDIDIPKNDTITFKVYIILFGNINYWLQCVPLYSDYSYNSIGKKKKKW